MLTQMSQESSKQVDGGVVKPEKDGITDFFLLQKKLNDRQVMALTSRGLMNSLLLPLVALGKG